MTERQDATMRLLDVLLEEELGGARAAAPVRRSPWLWAAALLGISVVVGMALLRPPATAPRMLQDPIAPTRFVPADAEAFRAAVANVHSIALAPREAPRGVPVLAGMPLIGNLFRKNAAPTGALQDLASTAVLARFVLPASELPIWRDALLDCADGGVGADASDPVVIDLPDGRRLDCLITAGLLVVRGDDKNLFLRAPQTLLDLRNEAARRQLAHQRHELGIALDANALSALPAGQTTLSMPPDPELVAMALTRLPKLERLRLFDPATDLARWTELASVLSGNRSLRRLHVPAAGLTDESLRALQPIGLHELEFDGALTSIPDAAFRGFDHLESLAIPAIDGSTEIAAILDALPALRRVELGTDLWRDELVDLLLRVPIEHLRIGGHTVDAAALKRLPLFPHLRSLDLFLCQIGPDELAALANVKQLTTMRLRMITWHQPAGHAEVIDIAALQRKLPKCTVINDDS